MVVYNVAVGRVGIISVVNEYGMSMGSCKKACVWLEEYKESE